MAKARATARARTMARASHGQGPGHGHGHGHGQGHGQGQGRTVGRTDRRSYLFSEMRSPAILSSGKIFFRVRDYIAEKRPRVFILENVSGNASPFLVAPHSHPG
jgi:hypothetical protein